MMFPFVNTNAQSLSHSRVSKERSTGNSPLHLNKAVNKPLVLLCRFSVSLAIHASVTNESGERKRMVKIGIT